MQNKEERKVLLQISNLKQYFPVGKKGMFVKANDGISIDIYEGETFGLVGESGCGKSTLGRSILQLYKQTDGRTMYFGRSIDELAPQYVYNTFRNLGARKEHMFATRKKYEEFQAEYDKLPEQEQYLKHAELTKLRKEANDAMWPHCCQGYEACGGYLHGGVPDFQGAPQSGRCPHGASAGFG